MSEAAQKKAPRTLNDAYVNQINVLKILSGQQASSLSPRQYQIKEIAALAGLNDEREVQRYLFILEGQKLVEPFPEGDFTSKVWRITAHGMKALRSLSHSLVRVQ